MIRRRRCCHQCRVTTRHEKPGKMRVHLENLEISWNFEKCNKNHGKMINLAGTKKLPMTSRFISWKFWEKNGPEKESTKLLKYCVNISVRNSVRVFNLEYSWNGQFFIQIKLSKFAYLYSKQLRNYFKIMRNNEKNTWKYKEKNLEKSCKSHGIFQSGKVRTLQWHWQY